MVFSERNEWEVKNSANNVKRKWRLSHCRHCLFLIPAWLCHGWWVQSLPRFPLGVHRPPQLLGISLLIAHSCIPHGGLCLALGNRTIQNRPLCVGERQQHADLGLHGSTHLPYFGTALKGCPGTRAAPLMSFVSVTTTLRVHLPLHSPVLLYFLGGNPHS